MLNEPIKKEESTTLNVKGGVKNTEHTKATEDQIIDKNSRKDYDVQATNTKVIPSQK